MDAEKNKPASASSRGSALPVAPEGLPLILTALILGALLLLLVPVVPRAPRMIQPLLSSLVVASPIVLALGLFSAFFFRDPERDVPDDPDVVLSAADGRVTAITEDAEGLKISVFLSVFDVHVNRAPVGGTVVRTDYKQGEFLAAWKPLAEEVNERMAVTLRTARGPVEVIQVAGLIARRIVCRVMAGDELRAGERYGLIRFGSCTIVRLPPGQARALVRVKDRVRGGVTPIARWTAAAAD